LNTRLPRTLLALSLVASGTAFAAEAAPRVLVGAGIGSVHYGYDSARCTTDLAATVGAPCTVDGQGRGLKLYGGVQFTPYVAVEAGYHDFGTLKGKVPTAAVTVKEEQAAFTLALAGTLPLGEHFAAFGRIGYFRASLDATASGPGGTATLSDETGNVLLGGGVRLMANDRIGTRVEYELFQKAGDGETDIDAATVSFFVLF
jgi:hypothetical protein